MEVSMYQRLQAAEARLAEIDSQLIEEGITKDISRFRALSKERAILEPQVGKFLEYKKLVIDKEQALEMSNESDSEIAEMGKEEYKRLIKHGDEIIAELRELLLPKDPNDDKNIIVEIRGAVGGDEANIFAGDLFRMYSKYAETEGWKLQLLNSSPSEAGGYSLISFKIKGDMVYSKLKFESGAHRVQRVPKTETQGRVHTSTATVLVLPEIEDTDFDLNPDDLVFDIHHASGAGGQHVNKTASAVRVTHTPTGISVNCQDGRSQHANRATAIKLIRSRVYEEMERRELEEKGVIRKTKIGTGDRSEKIRTYNYPQNRVSDHRIGLTINQLDRIMDGKLGDVIDALIAEDQKQKLAGN